MSHPVYGSLRDLSGSMFMSLHTGVDGPAQALQRNLTRRRSPAPVGDAPVG